MKLEIRDGHPVGVVARPLPWPVASQLAADLARDGIFLLIEAGTVVHLTALVPMSTADEVRALRAVSQRTDARLAWHEAEAVAR